jgi:pimeloyl-ACP methyl ester carboxylesterase
MRCFFWTIVLVVTSVAIQAQDLSVVLSSINYSNRNIYQQLIVSGQIKNIGTTTAGSSVAMLHLSNNSTFNVNNSIGTIAVPAIIAGNTHSFKFVYTIPVNKQVGTYNVVITVDKNNTVIETNEQNTFVITQPLIINATKNPTIKLPYPIVFIHGLIGNSGQWKGTTDVLDTTLGYCYGGRLDFCLNADHNKFVANMTTDIIDFTARNAAQNIVKGDYYTINFDTDSNGTYDVNDLLYQSNQSAIRKQGYAVGKAIQHILTATGANKVIVVGHSMGGLATREYLSNSVFWQPDGKHHIAKLLTLGTPHGGSNSTVGLYNLLIGIDGNSDAARDLRYPSLALNFPGKYLFGGTENLLTSGGFNNEDINCNGIIGDAIVGLNNQTLPTDVAYTSLFADNSALGGDGVVDALRANINNYGLTNAVLKADTFINHDFTAIENHMDLLVQAKPNIKAMDEPNSAQHGYELPMDKLKMGLLNVQSNGVIADKDYYTFYNDSARKVYLNISNIYINGFGVKIQNSSGNFVLLSASNNNSNIDTNIQLAVGKYTIELEAGGYASGAQNPYYISIGKHDYFKNAGVITTTIQNVTNAANTMVVYPNPSSSEINMRIDNNSNTSSIYFELIDIIGRKVYSHNELISNGINVLTIDIKNIETGSYIIKTTTNTTTYMQNKIEIIK